VNGEGDHAGPTVEEVDLGFIGALCYYLHTHSGTFWLVLLAFMKAVVWPAFVVYYVLTLT
jgi:hypothetical protein